MNRNFPANPYPIAAFPSIIRKAIEEIITNIQSPDSIAGMAVVTTMSAAVQGYVGILHPITGKELPASIYQCVVANSGERKSTVDNLVSKPLREFDEFNQRKYEKELREYKVKMLIWNQQKKVLLNGIKNSITNGERHENWDEQLSEHLNQEPSKPQLRVLMHQNTSERALLESLDGEGRSIAIISDEGEIILQSPLFNKWGLMNACWEAATLSLNRASGIKITARNPRLTISMMVQGSVFLEFLEKRGSNARGTGFFARFLMAWPQSTQGYRFTRNMDPTWEHLAEFHKSIQEALENQTNEHSSEHSGKTTYKLDEDAKVLFVSLLNHIEQLIQPQKNLSDIHDFASKTGEIMLRIAALLHHFGKQPGEITCDTLRRAMEIVNFHLIEFQRIFSPEYQIPQHQTDAESIINHLNRLAWKNGLAFVPKNEIYRRTGIRNHTRFNTALDFLIQQGIVAINRILPSKTFYIFLNQAYFQQLNAAQLISNPQIQSV